MCDQQKTGDKGKYKLPLQSRLPKLNYIPNLRSEVTTT